MFFFNAVPKIIVADILLLNHRLYVCLFSFLSRCFQTNGVAPGADGTYPKCCLWCDLCHLWRHQTGMFLKRAGNLWCGIFHPSIVVATSHCWLNICQCFPVLVLHVLHFTLLRDTWFKKRDRLFIKPCRSLIMTHISESSVLKQGISM